MVLSQKRRLGCALTMVAASLLVPSTRAAHAADFVTSLDYRAAVACPSAAEFGTVVAGRLGYNPFRKDASQRVIVRINPSGKGLEGRLEWRDAAGAWLGDETLPSRTGNCAELVRAMGFALAIQFQLMAAGVVEMHGIPPAASTAPAPTTSVPTAPPPLPPVAAMPAQESPRPDDLSREQESVTIRNVAPPSETPKSGPSILVGAGAAVALGAAASAVPVGRLFGAVAWSHALIELGAELNFPSTTLQANGAGFSEREFLGSVAGCGVFSPWGACVVAKLGEIRVTGQGVDVPTTSGGLMTQAGLRFTATQRLGSRLELTGHADGLALLTLNAVTIDSATVWTTPRFTAALGLDLVMRFR